MKVKKIIRYKNGLPLGPFYYDVDDQGMRIFDSRTDKPVVIYTLDFYKACSSNLYFYIGAKVKENVKMKFVCKRLPKTLKEFYGVPVGSSEAECRLPFCTPSGCSLAGKCSFCAFSSECSMFRENGECPESDCTVRVTSEDDLPF